jgi:hypothetical protein
MPHSGFRYNPAVYADPQVIPRLMPPRGRGRPTLYSLELVEEFCGLLVDGMTIDKACKEGGMPSKRTIQYWLNKYPEFRREFEDAVFFRNECWMDDCVDIADDVASGLSTAERKLRCDMRWKQLRGARLKAVARPCDNAKATSEEKVQFVANDPVHALLYQWELEYERRRGKSSPTAKARTGQVNERDWNGGR